MQKLRMIGHNRYRQALRCHPLKLDAAKRGLYSKPFSNGRFPFVPNLKIDIDRKEEMVYFRLKGLR